MMRLTVRNNLTTITINVTVGKYRTKYSALKSEPDEISKILERAKEDLWNLGDKSKANEYMRNNSYKWLEKTGLLKRPDYTLFE